MKKLVIAAVFGLAVAVSAPAFAVDTAECAANWAKMDTKKAGFVMSTDAKDQMDAMTKAGRKTAAADRMSDKEYMDACVANVFTANQR